MNSTVCCCSSSLANSCNTLSNNFLCPYKTDPCGKTTKLVLAELGVVRLLRAVISVAHLLRTSRVGSPSQVFLLAPPIEPGDESLLAELELKQSSLSLLNRTRVFLRHQELGVLGFAAPNWMLSESLCSACLCCVPPAAPELLRPAEKGK